MPSAIYNIGFSMPSAMKWDLAHLQGRQRQMVEEVLLEADAVFSKSDEDIGNVPEFQMPIKLVDDVPVTEAYRRIQPHLYQEVPHLSFPHGTL